MIDEILEGLVKAYQDNVFINYSRDISFNAARKELLGNGTVSFREVSSTTPKNFKVKGCAYYSPNPIIADCHGRFDSVEGDGNYTVIVRNQTGNQLLIGDI